MDPRPDRVTDLIPFVHVSDLPRSIAFYALLGLAEGAERRPAGGRRSEPAG